MTQKDAPYYLITLFFAVKIFPAILLWNKFKNFFLNLKQTIFSRKKRRSSKMDDESIIRLHPCAMVEIEQLLFQLHVPPCVICKRPIVVNRLSYTCEQCDSCYHATCMLRYFLNFYLWYFFEFSQKVKIAFEKLSYSFSLLIFTNCKDSLIRR